MPLIPLNTLTTAPQAALVAVVVAVPVIVVTVLLLVVVPVALFADRTRSNRARAILGDLLTALAGLARCVARKTR